MSIVEYLSQPFWQRLGLTLVHFLWQGLAVAVLVGVFVRVLRLKHGNARYGAYLLALIAMIACPVVTFTAIDIDISANTEPVTVAEPAEVVDISPSPYTALPAGDVLPEVETVRPAIPISADSIPLGQRISGWLNVLMPWVLVIWMAGVAVLSVRLLMGFVGVYRWRHHLEPLPERLVQRIASLSEVLGMRRFSRVFISPTVLQAMAVGYLRPIVLLPAAMLTQMQPEMLEAVIAHELAHIRRFDLWINLVQRITETLLFYHPAVWWLSNCIRRERELCCDELAVKATGERITYASTLESVGRARFIAKQPILAAGLGQDKKPTLGRVRHILGLKPAQRNCPFWMAGVITVLFLAALVIPTTLALTNRSDEKLNDLENVVVEGDWGEAVEGIEMRVRVERQRWYEGETPKFLVDMRNKGTVEWELGLTQENWEVELDGVWHRVGASFSGDFRTLLFGPGQEYKDIEFYPGVWSGWNIHGKPLKFTPGLHTVRLSFGPSTRDRAYWRRLSVVSNPVVIEILPADADKRGWGEAVAGMQCGLRADKRLWKADETPKLQAVARNVGLSPWRLPRPSELFYLKVGSKIWRWKGTLSDRPADLKPGEVMDKTTILLSEDWVGAYGSDLRLKLSPGKHTVQLVMFVSDRTPPESVPGTRPIPRQLRIESNVVAIEVLPKGERDGTVDDEDDAATTLQAELDELWLQRDQGLAAAEAFGKRLLEKYTKREEKPLIYYQLAEIYAQSGQADPNKIVEFARQGWWFLNDPVKKTRLFIYWGDALQLTKGREEAARIYLRGLQFCLHYGLPKEKPELPTVSIYTADGPAEEVEKHDKENKRQMAARKHAKLIGELIEHRQVLTGRIVQLYAPLPDAFDELHELVMRYLGSEQACQQIIAAAKSYRNDPEMAIPVIMSIGGDPNPKADLDWGEETEGIRIRLRADTNSWVAGGVPKFKLDVRNEGSHILLLTSAPDCWGVEVDGVWYRVTISMLGGAKGMSFGPDKRWYNLELSLDKALGSQNENGGFELAPGRHTVRAALASGLSEDGEMLSVGAVSDPVEIVILPSDSDVKHKSDVEVEVEKTSQSQPSTTLPNRVTVEQPATIRVPEDYPTTYAAVKAAKSGDTLIISADRYQDEDILIEPKLEIEVKKPAVQVEGERKGGSVVQGKVLGPRGEPVRGATVELQIFVGGDVDDMANYRSQRVITDTNGLYVFEGLAAGSAHIGRAFTAEDGSTSGVPHGLMFDFEIEPGKSYDITLGGKGRPVAGRLVPASGNAGDIDWSKARAYFDLRAGPFSMGAWESSAKIARAMIKEEGGNFYGKSPVKLNPDGTFRIDNVRAGLYMLRVKISEEPKRDSFNLFLDVRIPLMRDGTTETPLNLGTLAVSHGDYQAPRHIDNKFLDKFELGRDIPVILKAGNDEEPDVVSTKSIRFEKDGESVTAALNIEWKSIVADRWKATLKFRSENGSTLARSDVFFKTSKMIERYTGRHSESLHFAPGLLSDLSKVKHFLLTIQPVREQLTAAVQKDRDARNSAEAIKQVEVEKTASNNSGSDSKHYQLVTFKEGMSIREALRFLGKAYKKNIIPSEKVAGQVPVNELYNVTFEETLQAILGTHKYIIDGNFIRVYTEEEFESIYPEEKTNSQVKIEKSTVPAESEQSDKSAVQVGQMKQQRARELIYILRHHVIFSRADEWTAAIKELAEIGSSIVPELVTELDSTQRGTTIRGIAFALRAIGDPRAVPALIRALPKSSSGGSDCSLKVADKDTFEFMLKHQIETATGASRMMGFCYGRPVREVTSALEKITGNSEGYEHYFAYDEEGNRLTGTYTVTPEIRDRQKEYRLQVVRRWQRWWDEHKHEFVTEEQLASVSATPENDLVEAAGLAQFGQAFPNGIGFKLGPVKEVLLPPNVFRDAEAFLDFETGRRFYNLQGVLPQNRDDYSKWYAQVGVDVWASRTNFQDKPLFKLRGWNIHTWQVENSRWDSFEEEVRSSVPIDMGAVGPRDDFRPRDPITREYLHLKRPATFLFNTIDGTSGILQVTSPARDPKGVRIRYRLIEGPQRSAKQQASSPVMYTPDVGEVGSFGPIIERLVQSATSDVDSALDLDTGHLSVPLAETQYPPLSNEFLKWIADEKIDVLAIPDPDGRLNTLSTFGMKVVSISPELWNSITPMRVREMLWSSRAHAQSGMYVGGGTIPKTYPVFFIFETREGGAGKLQISGLAENPQGIKIRYKLLNKGSDSKSAVQVGGEGIKTEIQEVVKDFWKAVTTEDWQSVNEYSEMDILKQRDGALEHVLAGVGAERKRALSRGMNISRIDEVYIEGREAIAIGPANRDRFQWYYLQKRGGVWVIKLFDDAPPRLSVQDVFFKCRTVDKLMLMGESLAIFAAEHQGKLPDNFEALEPYIPDKSLRAWLRKHVEYLGKGKEMEKVSNNMVAYTKTLVSKDENISVLFNDGNVDFVRTSQVSLTDEPDFDGMELM